MKPDDLLALAEALEVAERHGHVHAVRGIQETVLAQKLLVKYGLAEEEEEEEGEDEEEDEGFGVAAAAEKKGVFLSLSRLGSGSAAAGGGGGEVLEKAVHLLDRADSWMSKVVLRSAGGGGGDGHA